jgi:peptidoglycan/xylan/chitin deacetylase (PgdA/CDA1 family)
MNRREMITGGAAALALARGGQAAERVPVKTVVLTFDDAVKSHRTIVGPLLKEYGFGASFFVTQHWMADRENFMSWQDIADLHRMGFEIGNHSWTHANFGSAASAPKLDEELGLVERELERVGVPKPVSFAWCGNAFGPECVQVLRSRGYRFARRGMQPEVPYGLIEVGIPYVPDRHHPLLIPTTGDAYPTWTAEHFRAVIAQALPGQVAVVQFHGVPDVAHPWVHTPPERFREYLAILKAERFSVLALRDVATYVDEAKAASDPALQVRYPK